MPVKPSPKAPVRSNGFVPGKKSARHKRKRLFKKFLRISIIFLFLIAVIFIAGVLASLLHSAITGAPVTSAPSVSVSQKTTVLTQAQTTAETYTTEKQTAATEVSTTASEPSTAYSGDISWIPPEGLMAPPGYTGKIAYLTFDDGPSLSRTPKILDILKAYGINATFFLIGQNIHPYNYSIIKRAFDEGNVIGNHTYDHLAAGSSFEHFKTSVNKTSDLIEQITGKRPECFRFPGGSNSGYMKNVIHSAIPWLHDNGYEYFDWSTSTGDGNGNVTYSAQQLCSNAMKAVYAKHLVVLMHDSAVDMNHPHDAVGAVPLIIRALYDRGYKFGVLTRHSIAPHFMEH